MTIPAYVAAILLATLYGAVFHFFVGGSVRRMLLYLLSGWVGFALGHILGNAIEVTLLRLGPLNLLAATAGAFTALFTARWLAATRILPEQQAESE